MAAASAGQDAAGGMEGNGNSRSPQPMPYTMHGTDVVRIPGNKKTFSHENIEKNALFDK